MADKAPVHQMGWFSLRTTVSHLIDIFEVALHESERAYSPFGFKDMSDSQTSDQGRLPGFSTEPNVAALLSESSRYRSWKHPSQISLPGISRRSGSSQGGETAFFKRLLRS